MIVQTRNIYQTHHLTTQDFVRYPNIELPTQIVGGIGFVSTNKRGNQVGVNNNAALVIIKE